MRRRRVIAIWSANCTLLSGAWGRWLLPYGFPLKVMRSLKCSFIADLLSKARPRLR
jgi:hypothetical protein